MTSDPSRERILRAAASLAAEVGYDGTTIAAVTERSGLPASSIYWFFANKDELLAEALRHAFTTFLATQPRRDPLPQHVPISTGVRQIMEPALLAMADPPDYLRIGTMLMLDRRTAQVPAREQYLQVRREIQTMITDWFERELPESVLSRAPELPHQFGKLVLSYYDGVFLTTQAGVDWDPHEALRMFMNLVDSVLARFDE